MFGTGNELDTTHWFRVDGCQGSILNDWCVNDAVCVKIHVCDLNIIHTRGYASRENTRDLLGENVLKKANLNPG